MRYIVTKTTKAAEIGIEKFSHLVSEYGEIIINEVELIDNNKLTGDFETRVKTIRGKVFDGNGAKIYSSKNKFKLWHNKISSNQQ